MINTKTLKNLLGVGLLCGAASAANLHAQPYYVAGANLTPPWTPGDLANVMAGGPTVYSLTTATIANAYHEFKITGATWGDPNWPAGNAKTKGDANGTNTFYFFPGTITDGWLPVANRVGYADPGNVTWEIIGDFNGWDVSQPANAQMVNQGNGLYKVDYVIATAGTYGFKFRTPGSWSDLFMGTTFENGGANASVTTTGVNQTVTFQLDLPNGRWLAGSLAPAPVTNNVTFQVDMTAQILLGSFIPGTGTIRVTGSFPPTSWGDGLDLTNNPALSGNASNIYSTNLTIVDLPQASFEYKFRANGVYESVGNRTFKLASTNGDVILPLVYYNDASACDLLQQDTTVTFVIQITNGTVAMDGAVFVGSPSGNNLYINGAFPGWSTWDALLPQPVNNPSGSDFYEYTLLIPRGRTLAQTFKLSIGGPDNENASEQNHVQYIRTLGSTYTMPVCQFGTNFNATRVEASFGNLAIGAGSGGTVPITWSGRQCVTLQTRSSLSSGFWTDISATDGSSSTNWPVGSDPQFFRLQQRSNP